MPGKPAVRTLQASLKQPLKPSILLLKFLQALGLIDPQTSVLFAPAVVRLLRDLEPSTDRLDRLAFREFDLSLTQLVDDLLRAVALQLVPESEWPRRTTPLMASDLEEVER